MQSIFVTQPIYDATLLEWIKWRLTYEGGQRFIGRYLVRQSTRETDADFANRTTMAYCPAFAKAAINEVKNAIFQRIADVTREGGPKSYLDCCKGLGTGVDLRGSSMNSFIGKDILAELLVMRKVGVYVDREAVPPDSSLADPVNHPYLYVYKAEDILNWDYVLHDQTKLRAVLLRDNYSELDVTTNLPNGCAQRYRYVYLGADNKVHVQLFQKGLSSEIDKEVTLNISRIPFVVFELTHSLLMDAANYQIALLNMESADISYMLKANFPFYTEQVDGRTSGSHLKDGNDKDVEEVTVGAIHGRKYPKSLERPGFIAPPVDPIKISMEKQEQMKNDIRRLINLALETVKGVQVSAESKSMDERGLEAGLSCIGMELERAERVIASIWAEYENSDVTTVNYPARYSLKTDSEILDEAKELKERMFDVPSETYRKAIAKRICTLMLGTKVSNEILEKMLDEIENSKILITDPKVIGDLVEKGIMCNESAALAMSLPKDEPIKAANDHAERAKRIAIAQSEAAAAARGIPDLGIKTSGDGEKNNNQQTKQLDNGANNASNR